MPALAVSKRDVVFDSRRTRLPSGAAEGYAAVNHTILRAYER